MKKRKKVLKIEKVSWRNKNLMGKIERLRNKKSHKKNLTKKSHKNEISHREIRSRTKK